MFDNLDKIINLIVFDKFLIYSLNMGASCCTGQEMPQTEKTTTQYININKNEEYPKNPSPLNKPKSPLKPMNNSERNSPGVAGSNGILKNSNNLEDFVNHFPTDYAALNLTKVPQSLLAFHMKMEEKLPKFNHEYRIDPEEADLPEGNPYKNPVTSNIYVGQWKGGLPHGRGIMYYFSGDIYEGHWLFGKRNGKGRLIYSNEEYYEGNFEDNVREGEGFYKGRDSEYEGSWKNDLQDGFGKETWKDGGSYEGSYVQGVKEGKGKFEYTFGYYIGQFKDNLRHGEGQMSFKDGKLYNGQWKFDAMEGKGEFVWPDGTKYIGMYEKGIKEGLGMLIWPNGKKFIGQFKNGLQDGEGKMENAGIVREGIWKDGKRIKWIINE